MQMFQSALPGLNNLNTAPAPATPAPTPAPLQILPMHQQLQQQYPIQQPQAQPTLQQQQLHVIAPQNYPQPQQLQQLGTFTPAPPIQRQTPDPILAPETQQANTIFGQHQQILSKPETCFPPVSRLYFLSFHCHL